MSFNKPLFEEKVVIGLKMLGLEYEQTQLDLLSMFSAEFFKWNSVHNLSAIQDENEYLSAHVMDSLGAINPILKTVHSGLLSKDAKIVDLGVGGGFPGMVLAIFLPEFRFSLIDAVRKKTVFLKHAAGRMKLKNVSIFEQRIEHFAQQYPNAFDATISRAFTELSAFVNYSRPLVREGGVMFAMKSQKISEEIIALSESEKIIWMEELKIPFLDAYRCILAIQSMRKFSI
jgi:16S rRNA (guanine527-N7)-methyltransferase